MRYKKTNMYENECSICLSDIHINNSNYTTLTCDHIFHTECINKNKNDLCPLCRQKYINNNIIDLESNISTDSVLDGYKKLLPLSCGLILICIGLLVLLILL